MIPTLLFTGFSFVANAVASPLVEPQQPLSNEIPLTAHREDSSSHGLTGRFLHITGMVAHFEYHTTQKCFFFFLFGEYGTDVFSFTSLDPHPDPYYTPGSTSNKDCHRGHGSSGYLGAEGTECDAPLSLVDATLRWIEHNLKGKIDFVIWTGDSARHDQDVKTPRTMDEIVRLNEVIADKFIHVFQENPKNDSGVPIGGPPIPIIPTIGNNDIMPHNTMKEGPNRWTRTFADVWSKFIPESQRHSFVEGGWFTADVIPGKLAAISLNTMYFYGSNAAVDGCEDTSEPGYEHMEWLRVQLKLLRERQMKAILIGHVAPARAGSKRSWDETCWQKYTLWVNRYRDVIVGSVYGHMNFDHFMLQDSHDVDIADLVDGNKAREEFSVQSDMGYLKALQDYWYDLPSPPSGVSFNEDLSIAVDDGIGTDRSKKKKMKRFLKKIGGPLAERYSVSLVSPSLVPNFYPTLRVIEYNITGLENTPTWADTLFGQESHSRISPYFEDEDTASPFEAPDVDINKKKKKPKFKIPDPPPSSALPGPAYSNQPLSWLSYTQYFANITRSNEEIASHGSPINESLVDDVFDFEVEYDTRDDHIYNMKDLTVRSFFDLALRIGGNAPSARNDDFDTEKKKKKKRKNNKAWRTFLNRAFVGYFNVDDL